MTTAFITGINGFAGQWLAKLLLSKGMTVYGIDLQEHGFTSSIRYLKADLLDMSAITGFLDASTPDLLFNLAGVSFLPDADASPRAAINTNTTAVMILLDAVREVSPATRVLLVGSSREYTPQHQLLTEESPLTPANFYGISKLSSELIGLQYHRQFGIDVRCTRSFNHTGPGQSPRFVCSEWAHQIALIAKGITDPVITVGGLDTQIDFSDVRDTVDAYHKILADGRPGEVYNVCSGKGTDLQWILDHLLGHVTVPVTVTASDTKVRKTDRSLSFVGNHDKLTNHTGWTPSTPLDRTLDDLYNWWHDQLSSTRQ